MKTPLTIAMALALAGCGSLLGGGREIPPTLATLTPEAAMPATMASSTAVGNAIVIEDPIVPQALSTDRVPVLVGPTAIAYVTDVVWVDRPAPLFRDLVAETVRRRTGRLVLDPQQTGINAGQKVTGTLSHFGYHPDRGEVVVRYDASVLRDGQIVNRRFEAAAPADGTAGTVPQALNTAANVVAIQVADWLGR